MFQLLFSLVLIFVTGAIAVNQLIQNVDKVIPNQEILNTFRLPNNTVPETYNVSIRTWIHEANATFTGFVRIGILAVETTDFITLHHHVARLESVRVITTDDVPISIGDYSYDSEFEFLTIPVVDNLVAGTRYFIEIDYIGSMNYYSGFYRSFYIVNGEEKWFGSTQFEPTNARRAFPCYDELALKANFTIRITHDRSLSALSNMPTISETPQPNPDGSVTTEFETSPRMSTYLVAFHVSDFHYATTMPPRDIPQRMYARTDAITETALALEAGELLIDAISDYLGMEYSLPKMDQVGVPGFPSGAMENWGLITYYEYYFLFNETVDLYYRSFYAVTTISHELSHQWFGNLVTPSWWTYLWMKEGFATLFEYLGVDLAYPDWDMMDYFVVNVVQYVFISDGNEFTRPMTQYVEHPYEIENQFNNIAYSKAGSVLRMFLFMLGESTFMRGVKYYLEDNSYSDATEEDLFDSLAISVWLEPEEIIPPTVDLTTIMASWTRQAGYPLITVERNYDDRTDQVTLRQERYYAYTDPENRVNTTWWVPYNFATPSNPGFENTRAEGWIPQGSHSLEITVDSLGADDYLLMSKRAAGYYRILYDERNYRLISDAMIRNSSLFHSTNKAQLIDDVYQFYRTGVLPLTPLLDLLRVLEFDAEYVSWHSAFTAIWTLHSDMRGHRNYPMFADFLRTISEHLYDTVRVEDIPNEPILNKYARESVVHLACDVGSVHCLSDANRQLRDFMVTGREFHQNIRSVVKCASVRSASRAEFHFLWELLLSYPVDDYTLRPLIIDALGCSTSRPLLNEYIRSSLNSTNTGNREYSPYEVYSIFSTIIQNGGNIGLDVVLAFLNENAIEAFETYGSYSLYLLSYAVSRADHIELYLSFQDILHDAGLISQAEIDFHMEIVADSVRWLDTEGEVISNWLIENFQ